MLRYLPALQRLLYKFRTPPKDKIHDYWRDPPDAGNRPEYYLEPMGGTRRSEFLVSLIDAPKDARILEIGCNVGRNLHVLAEHGYTNLHGIEISARAVEKLHEHYPNLGAEIHTGPAEEILPTFPDAHFDLTFTMAVLVHIHPDSDWILREIARISTQVLTIEGEVWASERHFPRNYRKVFEGLGMSQIREIPCEEGTALPDSYVARAFTN